MVKTVIITGGNRGIGRSLTECFVNEGYFVIVGARQPRNIEDLAPNRVRFIEIDVRNREDHDRLVKAAQDAGKLTTYINNAGFSEWRPLQDIDNTFFETLINTNLKSAFWGCQAAAQAMSDGGSIINISSLAGKRGSANNAMYVASKFGMNGLTQSLAKELGPKGIRVNAICPVLVRTKGLIEALKAPQSPAAGDPDNFLENFRQANSALGHLPTGHEVGNYATYLASDRASAITGQCVNVDCGVFPQ